ncbi:flagellar hook-basal body complex protein FliE [Pannonibacter sp. Q-1]|uniref:Flagellar hook-basal body complex protein FliE n=3 Tax=Pannonibacter TaxID=227873 RepID=A0A0U3PBR7_9HYPH|nr:MULTISPECIES: flagellar hook-basal body complex protein FliE [Pannonibacter]ALV26355.1 flagellar hook-basal body protein FliE [Pannonibacter phragmitetus]MBA4205163.1 flagellar hook-basal body complex protein FliE [Polymorphum sp.]CUA92581.1 Flagellar hook-basal body complex protein FliE [Pannonibacter indicus]SUA99495.1 flagellar hook-basal body protein FliE [Pannonibacter phragmitetus]
MIDQISAIKSAGDGITSQVSQTRYVAGGVPLGGTAPANAVPEVSFTDTMASVTQEAIERVKEGEAVSIAGISGKASAQQVVEAVMAAEASLQTAIAIRDKVVSAYQEVSRMAI